MRIMADHSSLSTNQVLRCTLTGCNCLCFSPSTRILRQCDNCAHGWITHALDKVGLQSFYGIGMAVELVRPSMVFDLASLVLYGTQAVPMRLKILLDRLFSVLSHSEILNILHSFGWKYEDYSRGYVTQDAHGRVLESWTLCSTEEEALILQQFIRFGETRTLTHNMLLQESKDRTTDLFTNFRKVGDTTAPLFSQLAAYSPIFSADCKLAEETANTSGKSTGVDLSTPMSEISENLTSDEKKEQDTEESDAVEDDKKEKEKCEEQASSITEEFSEDVVQKIEDIEEEDITDEMEGNNRDECISSDHSVLSMDDHNSHLFECLSPCEQLITYSSPNKRCATSSPTPSNDTLSPKSKKLSSATFNKRRVLCTVCNKTFCDKGALKIHYSAVHLKEMHRCTIAGCSMWFSSRRSRNRHSANPNPRLHMMHSNRKLPDGARIVDDGSGRNLASKVSMPSCIINPPVVPAPVASTTRSSRVAEEILEEVRREASQSTAVGNAAGIKTCKRKNGVEKIHSEGDPKGDEPIDLVVNGAQFEDQEESETTIEKFRQRRQSDAMYSDRDRAIDDKNSFQEDSVCLECGRHFLTSFSLRQHYQDAHLKMLHQCTVEGCNATFPSKRSRDRHSSNSALHLKLLSTCNVDVNSKEDSSAAGCTSGSSKPNQVADTACGATSSTFYAQNKSLAMGLLPEPLFPKTTYPPRAALHVDVSNGLLPPPLPPPLPGPSSALSALLFAGLGNFRMPPIMSNVPPFNLANLGLIMPSMIGPPRASPYNAAVTSATITEQRFI